jgi:tetratricopeptide (TPR) repeat protein
LTKKRNFKALLPHLSCILGDSDEYISHQTALFLLGFASDPGKQITIVSPRRRRNREIEGFEIVFVYHSSFDNKYSQIINISGEQLNVSSLEKTLIDLTKDLNYSPGLETLARLFCIIPYNPKQLINVAKSTSDTVLKRVSLLLAWSGRAAYYELPLKNFKRTPVKLDSREEENLIWNSLFYTKLPARLLMLPVSEPPKDIDEKIRLWMELKALPEFCEKQFQSGMVFIRETPEPRINRIIEEYFSEIYMGFSEMKFEEFLAGYDTYETAFPPKIPALLRTFLHSHDEILMKRFDEISRWVSKNLYSGKLDIIEAAIYYGLKIGLTDEVFHRFEETCSDLFYGGKSKIINCFADHFLDSSYVLTPKMLLNITKTYSLQEKFDKALNILEQAKVDAEEAGGDLAVMGQLHYATALVFQRMERAEDALSELFLAKESLSIAGNEEELTRTECSLGNLYFTHGHPDSARSHYIAGLSRARNLKNKSLQASFLANLGMVEYDMGRFQRASSYLSQAYGLNKMLKNQWTASVVGMALGKLQLKLGHFSKSLRIFREIFPIRQQKGNASGIYEICCILAWIYEIIGKTATAKTYWNQADKLDPDFLEPRSRFVGSMLKAMNHFFHKRFNEAESLFAAMLHTAETRNASGIQRGDCMHGLAVAKFFAGKVTEAYELFKTARETIGINSGRLQLVQVDFIAGLLFPKHFPEINLDESIKILLGSGIYDPLWIHFANHLLDFNSRPALDYLEFHLEKTPPSAIKAFQIRFPEMRKIIRSIETTKNRAGEFVTLLSSEESSTVHNDDYFIWQKNYPQNSLVFDAPAGILIYNDSREKLKPGSIPHSILLQLFLALPHPVEIESLYKSAWGMNFDPEYDFGAVKSSLQRLKLSLKKVCSAAVIQRKKSSKGLKAVRLSVSVPWFLAFK